MDHQQPHQSGVPSSAAAAIAARVAEDDDYSSADEELSAIAASGDNLIQRPNTESLPLAERSNSSSSSSTHSSCSPSTSSESPSDLLQVGEYIPIMNGASSSTRRAAGESAPAPAAMECDQLEQPDHRELQRPVALDADGVVMARDNLLGYLDLRHNQPGTSSSSGPPGPFFPFRNIERYRQQPQQVADEPTSSSSAASTSLSSSLTVRHADVACSSSSSLSLFATTHASSIAGGASSSSIAYASTSTSSSAMVTDDAAAAEPSSSTSASSSAAASSSAQLPGRDMPTLDVAIIAPAHSFVPPVPRRPQTLAAPSSSSSSSPQAPNPTIQRAPQPMNSTDAPSNPFDVVPFTLNLPMARSSFSLVSSSGACSLSLPPQKRSLSLSPQNHKRQFTLSPRDRPTVRPTPVVPGALRPPPPPPPPQQRSRSRSRSPAVVSSSSSSTSSIAGHPQCRGYDGRNQRTDNRPNAVVAAAPAPADAVGRPPPARPSSCRLCLFDPHGNAEHMFRHDDVACGGAAEAESVAEAEAAAALPRDPSVPRCRRCGRHLRDSTLWWAMSKMRASRRSPCMVCGAVLASRNDLMAHLVADHAGVLPLQCPWCLVRFERPAEAFEHIHARISGHRSYALYMLTRFGEGNDDDGDVHPNADDDDANIVDL